VPTEKHRSAEDKNFHYPAPVPGARESRLLISLPPQHHQGQGTANACAFFDNAYLELLWRHDDDDLQSEVVRPTISMATKANLCLLRRKPQGCKISSHNRIPVNPPASTALR